MDHLLIEYPMGHFAMLTPHEKLVESCTQVSERFIKDLWNFLWIGGLLGPRWESLS